MYHLYLLDGHGLVTKYFLVNQSSLFAMKLDLCLISVHAAYQLRNTGCNNDHITADFCGHRVNSIGMWNHLPS